MLSPLFSVRMIAYCRFNSCGTKHQNETEDSVPSPISVREGMGGQKHIHRAAEESIQSSGLDAEREQP